MPPIQPHVVTVLTNLPGKQKMQLWPWAEPFMLWPVSGPYWHVETAQGACSAALHRCPWLRADAAAAAVRSRLCPRWPPPTQPLSHPPTQSTTHPRPPTQRPTPSTPFTPPTHPADHDPKYWQSSGTGANFFTVHAGELEPWALQPNATMAWLYGNSTDYCEMLQVKDLPRGWDQASRVRGGDGGGGGGRGRGQGAGRVGRGPGGSTTRPGRAGQNRA